MIKAGSLVFYDNACYRIHGVVDYKPYRLAQLKTSDREVWIPVDQLIKIDEL
jgi:hypothetical protein